MAAGSGFFPDNAQRPVKAAGSAAETADAAVHFILQITRLIHPEGILRTGGNAAEAMPAALCIPAQEDNGSSHKLSFPMLRQGIFARSKAVCGHPADGPSFCGAFQARAMRLYL